MPSETRLGRYEWPLVITDRETAPAGPLTLREKVGGSSGLITRVALTKFAQSAMTLLLTKIRPTRHMSTYWRTCQEVLELVAVTDDCYVCLTN